MVVVSPTATAANANEVFYRVVAVDAGGTASGCSDYAELPHPFIYSQPVTQARAGKPYRYRVKSLARHTRRPPVTQRGQETGSWSGFRHQPVQPRSEAHRPAPSSA